MKFSTRSSYSEMDVDNEPMPLLEASDTDKLLEEMVSLKNRVIGNKRQKMALVNQGIVNKLMEVIDNDDRDEMLKAESVIVLGSIAKGDDNHVKEILSAGAVESLIKGLSHKNVKYAELCLCCLRSLVQSPVCPNKFIYNNPYIVPHLLSLVNLSTNAQICVATILTECCEKQEHQMYLHSQNAVEVMLPGLHSHVVKIEMAVLKLYSRLCYENEIVSTQMLSACYNGSTLHETLKIHLDRDKPLAIRMLAAKCLVFMHRSKALSADDQTIMFRVLPTLVSCCKPCHNQDVRVDGAEMIAYLTEISVELQNQASITDHCIYVLSKFFTDNRGTGVKSDSKDSLHQAGLRAFASLAANSEDIRKKIIGMNNVMDMISKVLGSNSIPLQLAAIRCLTSLSRSVQLLRTSIQDHGVWKPLMNILKRGENEELMNMASSLLCNLLLEFSPSKVPILELGAIQLLINLTYSINSSLRLNAVWALMNLAFQVDQKVKFEIISQLGTDQLFCLLRDQCGVIVMKTLGLLRNLLTNKHHIDAIMQHNGDQVIQAVVMILESDHTFEVKEQTLCILGNITSGDNAKDFIMDNEDILKKILDYMLHSNSKLQIAAVCCVSHLACKTDRGYEDRHKKLKAMGTQKILQQLLNSSEKTISKMASDILEMFS